MSVPGLGGGGCPGPPTTRARGVNGPRGTNTSKVEVNHELLRGQRGTPTSKPTISRVQTKYLHHYIGQSLVQQNKNLVNNNIEPEKLNKPTKPSIPPPNPPSNKPAVLSAKDLTGAPLINYMPNKNRKLKKKTSVGCIEPAPTRPLPVTTTRLRHRSEQNLAGLAPPSVLPQYYLGQNLYQNLATERNNALYIQDFYQNPAFNKTAPSPPVYAGYLSAGTVGAKIRQTLSFDNLSDTVSVSSDESENFVPRIIRPRRRRKKERRRGLTRSGSGVATDEEESCLGSERQWLPTGLLSAESSCGSPSDSASSEEEIAPRSNRRKLAPTLSMPVYSSSQGRDCTELAGIRGRGGNVGGVVRGRGGTAQPGLTSPSSDYSSMASSTSDTPPTSSNDHLFDSDSGSTHSVSEAEGGEAQPPIGSATAAQQMLKLTKCPSTAEDTRGRRLEGRPHRPTSPHPPHRPHRPTPLRKTNSWAFMTSQANHGEFSLFSPGNSMDLLSGIRNNLSRIDLNDHQDDNKNNKL